MRLFDENGNEVEIDEQGRVVRKKKATMRDGEILRVPMMLMDKQTIDDAQSARDAIAANAASVRASIDRSLGVPIEPHPFQHADRRSCMTIPQSDEMRANRQALYDAANAKLSNAWKTCIPGGYQGD